MARTCYFGAEGHLSDFLAQLFCFKVTENCSQKSDIIPLMLSSAIETNNFTRGSRDACVNEQLMSKYGMSVSKDAPLSFFLITFLY